jgi:Na+-transporting methylmalonyl-CoA/oxaloacetate decarboxylase gamma subunit
VLNEDLQSAVLIGVIGIGLVLGVILVLWGLMALLVRVRAGRPSAGQEASTEPEAEDAEARQRRAAAVVAAVAAAVEKERAGDSARARAAAAAVGAYIAGESGAPHSEKDKGV